MSEVAPWLLFSGIFLSRLVFISRYCTGKLLKALLHLACKRAGHRECLKDIDRCSSVPPREWNLKYNNYVYNVVLLEHDYNVAPRPKVGPTMSHGGSSSRPIKQTIGEDNSKLNIRLVYVGCHFY